MAGMARDVITTGMPTASRAAGSSTSRAAAAIRFDSTSQPEKSVGVANFDEAVRPMLSKPVAITVIFTRPTRFGSTTAPKMMLASSCAAS